MKWLISLLAAATGLLHILVGFNVLPGNVTAGTNWLLIANGVGFLVLLALFLTTSGSTRRTIRWIFLAYTLITLFGYFLLGGGFGNTVAIIIKAIELLLAILLLLYKEPEEKVVPVAVPTASRSAGVVGDFGESASQTAGAAGAGAVAAVTAAAVDVSNKASDAADAASAKAAGAVDAVSDTASDAAEAVSDKAAGAVDAVSDTVSDAADAASAKAAGAVAAVTAAADDVSDKASDVADTASAKVAGAVDAVSDTVSDAADAVSDAAGEATEFVGDVASRAGGAALAAAAVVGDTAEDVVEDVKDAFRGVDGGEPTEEELRANLEEYLKSFGSSSEFNKNIEYIEGIGEVYGGKLRAVGVEKVIDLMVNGATRQGRKKLSDSSGISQSMILTWVNHVDLFRIKGVAQEYADLLEQSGVDTVVELAQRNPANLHKRMSEINEQKKLVRRLPHASDVQSWVEQAKELPRMIFY